MKRINTVIGVAAAVCCLAITSQATLLLPFTSTAFGGTAPTGILPGISGGPATTLTADYSVDLSSGIYTYAYRVNNPGTDTTSPIKFSVTFNAILNGTSVIATSAGGTVNTGSSVNWSFAPVAPGFSSGVMSFTSLLAPTFGNAGALDSIPPSPWSSGIPGGVPVAVPVPEPTTVIAGALLLLPFGASTLRFIRRSRGSV